MRVTLSYAEKIINALRHTKHTRDVIHNCSVDADAINQVLGPLFELVKELEQERDEALAKLAKAERTVAAFRAFLEDAECEAHIDTHHALQTAIDAYEAEVNIAKEALAQVKP